MSNFSVGTAEIIGPRTGTILLRGRKIRQVDGIDVFDDYFSDSSGSSSSSMKRQRLDVSQSRTNKFKQCSKSYANSNESTFQSRRHSSNDKHCRFSNMRERENIISEDSNGQVVPVVRAIKIKNSQFKHGSSSSKRDSKTHRRISFKKHVSPQSTCDKTIFNPSNVICLLPFPSNKGHQSKESPSLAKVPQKTFDSINSIENPGTSFQSQPSMNKKGFLNKQNFQNSRTVKKNVSPQSTCDETIFNPRNLKFSPFASDMGDEPGESTSLVKISQKSFESKNSIETPEMSFQLNASTKKQGFLNGKKCELSNSRTIIKQARVLPYRIGSLCRDKEEHLPNPNYESDESEEKIERAAENNLSDENIIRREMEKYSSFRNETYSSVDYICHERNILILNVSGESKNGKALQRGKTYLQTGPSTSRRGLMNSHKFEFSFDRHITEQSQSISHRQGLPYENQDDYFSDREHESNPSVSFKGSVENNSSDEDVSNQSTLTIPSTHCHLNTKEFNYFSDREYESGPSVSFEVPAENNSSDEIISNPSTSQPSRLNREKCFYFSDHECESDSKKASFANTAENNSSDGNISKPSTSRPSLNREMGDGFQDPKYESGLSEACFIGAVENNSSDEDVSNKSTSRPSSNKDFHTLNFKYESDLSKRKFEDTAESNSSNEDVSNQSTIRPGCSNVGIGNYVDDALIENDEPDIMKISLSDEQSNAKRKMINSVKTDALMAKNKNKKSSNKSSSTFEHEKIHSKNLCENDQPDTSFSCAAKNNSLGKSLSYQSAYRYHHLNRESGVSVDSILPENGVPSVIEVKISKQHNILPKRKTVNAVETNTLLHKNKNSMKKAENETSNAFECEAIQSDYKCNNEQTKASINIAVESNILDEGTNNQSTSKQSHVNTKPNYSNDFALSVNGVLSILGEPGTSKQRRKKVLTNKKISDAGNTSALMSKNTSSNRNDQNETSTDSEHYEICSENKISSVRKKKMKTILKKNQHKGELRRSSRVRFAPFDHWRNERLLYRFTNSGGVETLGVEPGSKDSTSWNIKNWVQTSKKKTNKEKQTMPSTSEEAVSVVNNELEEMIKAKVFLRYSSLSWRKPKRSVCDGGVFVARTFIGEDFAHGFLKLGSMKRKPGMMLEGYNSCFTVLCGKVEVTIHGNVRILKEMDSFVVPDGNMYSLNNLSDSECVLFYSATVSRFNFE